MLLASMLEAAHTFLQRAAQLAAQEGASSPIGLPAAVYPPFQPQLDRLTSVFRMQLPNEVSLTCTSLAWPAARLLVQRTCQVRQAAVSMQCSRSHPGLTQSARSSLRICSRRFLKRHRHTAFHGHVRGGWL